jgi:protein-tyrosine phosphatase
MKPLVVISSWLSVAAAVACGTAGNPRGDGTALCARRVLEEGVTNARELGGWPVTSGRLSCRQLLRGGALNGLDEAGCAEFAALGVHTVIDLREASVQTSAPPPGCVTAQARHVTAPMIKRLPDNPTNYLALLEETEAIRTLFTALATEHALAAYVHCELGRDRASFVTALLLSALGASRATVLDEFALSAEAGVPVKRDCMIAVLDELDRRGGIDAYLTAVGVEPATLASLRATVALEP